MCRTIQHCWLGTFFLSLLTDRNSCFYSCALPGTVFLNSVHCQRQLFCTVFTVSDSCSAQCSLSATVVPDSTAVHTSVHSDFLPGWVEQHLLRLDWDVQLFPRPVTATVQHYNDVNINTTTATTTTTTALATTSCSPDLSQTQCNITMMLTLTLPLPPQPPPLPSLQPAIFQTCHRHSATLQWR